LEVHAMDKWAAVVVLSVALTGCSDDSKPPLVVRDSGPIPDGGGFSFLEICQQNDECASGRCVQLGTNKRCTRSCSALASCPSITGWSCNSQSFCECAFTGKQPKVCNVDGDCDGQEDRPPKPEVCNDEDDDCNGIIDDVADGTPGTKQYFKDWDGDGFGDPNSSRWMCKPEQGWVLDGGDCDDARKQDNPNAEEICGDSYDNDCDGTMEDTDVCGLTPISVPDVKGSYTSATMKFCGTNALIDKSIDLTEILAKQDKTAIKFTLRLAGAPAASSPAKCSSYMLRLGDPKKDYALIYIYRPNQTSCGALAAREAYLNGKPVSTTVITAFNAADPGHVSFILDKTEFMGHMPTPTYKLEACANAVADASKDLTMCDDACTVPVQSAWSWQLHRQRKKRAILGRWCRTPPCSVRIWVRTEGGWALPPRVRFVYGYERRGGDGHPARNARCGISRTEERR